MMKKLKVASIILLAVSSLLFGCTPQVLIYDNATGQPALNNQVQSHSSDPEEGLMASFIAGKITPTSEYSYITEYLEPFSEYFHEINKGSEGLQIWLRVKNPKKIDYRVIYTKWSMWPGEEKFFKVEREIYSGDDSEKSWSISCPTDKKGKFKAEVTVLKESGNLLFAVINYVVK